MQLHRVFRGFLLGDVLLTTATIALGFESAEAASGASPDVVETVGRVVVLAAWLAALAGLWMFRRWARVLYVAVASIGILATLLLGGAESTGAKAALNSLCWLLTGAIIALMLWSTVAARFATRQARAT